MKKTLLASAIAVTTGILLSGCGSDSDDNGNADTDTGGSERNVSYATMDATYGERVFFDLSTGVTVAEDQPWHISYQKYIGYGLNGGASGSGSVQGCVAKEYSVLYGENGEPVVAEFEKLNADNTLTDFNNIDANSCSDFQSDKLKTHIVMEDWLSAVYGPAGPSFSAKTDASNGWIVRSATMDESNTPDAYGRVRVAEVNYSSNPATRELKFAVELWNAGTQAFDTETVTADFLNFTNGRVYWDMETNSKVTANDDWELSIEALGQLWNIQINSGVSGHGHAKIGVLPVGSAANVTNPTDRSQVYQWFTDGTVGTLSKPGDFGPMQYDMYGRHGMAPNFTHYLIRDGENTYKVQILNNYGEKGDEASGNLYLRYEAL